MDLPLPADRNLLAKSPSDAPRLPLIAASILGADLANIERDSAAAHDAGADTIHLDVMDGHFVPNLTMGPGVCKDLRAALPGATLDVHLMTAAPERWVEPFAHAGADHCTVHAEVVPPENRGPLFARIRSFGMTVGLAVSPGTPARQIEADLDRIDLALVMSVHPGFAGQSFIPEVIEKAAAIRDRGFRKWIQIDGGINVETAPRTVAAGCNVLVAASALFSGRGTLEDRIGALRTPSPA